MKRDGEVRKKKAKRIMEVKNQNRREKEEGGLGWGKSIPVPSVQEMVRNDQDSVPERYIQEHENRPHVNEHAPLTSYEIPVIDFTLLAKKDEDELKRLDLSCKEWGFFQVLSPLLLNISLLLFILS